MTITDTAPLDALAEYRSYLLSAAYTLGWRDHEAGISPRPPRSIGTDLDELLLAKPAADTAPLDVERLVNIIERFASQRRLQWSDDDIADLAVRLTEPRP